MFDPSKIQSCLTGLVGFPQTYLKDYDKIDSDLVASGSGVMIDQSAHPLMTIENITASAKDYLNTDTRDYDAAVTYAIDEVVVSSDIIYYSLQDSNTNNTPSTSATYWQPTTLVSFYLRRILKGAAINLFNTLFTQKKLYEAAKTLLTDISLYEGMGNLRNKVVKTGKFVGYKLNPRSADTVITISQIGFQVDTVQELLFYLYHDSQNEPVATFTLNLIKAISFSWNTLATALKLYFNNDDTGSGGSYYLGYYENDLTGQVIWRDTNFTGSGCSSCAGNNGLLFTRWNKYAGVQPMYVDADFIDYADKTLFDVDKVVYLNNQNWGMNLRLSVQCDVSDLICRNKYVFTDAYKLQIVKDVLNDMAYSVRDNQLKQKVQQMAMLALKGDKEDYSKGVESDLKDAIKAVSFDMSGMSKACAPCGNGMGIEVSSVYK